MTMLVALLVSAGGAVGAVLRGAATARRSAAPFGPRTAVVLVNAVASFALGAAHELDGLAAAAVTTGALGALSTWSTVADQIREMIDEGRRAGAVLMLGAGLVAGIAAAWIGLAV